LNVSVLVMSEATLQAFIRGLPKAELHAHLSGSLGQRTLNRLFDLKKKKSPQELRPDWPTRWPDTFGRDLKGAFQLFPLVQSLLDHPAAVELAVRSVAGEFAEDNVRYLELRTTPRATHQMSKRDYVLALERGASLSPIPVRILLSVDRGKSLKEAEDTLKLASTRQSEYLVGVDFSGNPHSGDGRDFATLLSEADFPRAIHLAEAPSLVEETMAMLDALQPQDRIGHATCVHPSNSGSNELWRRMLRTRSPVEVCLSSNVWCQTVKSYASHPVKHLWRSGHPFTLATDDVGIFRSTLSEEYQHAQKILSLDKEDLFKISYLTLDYSFASNDLKEKLKTEWKSFAHRNNIKV